MLIDLKVISKFLSIWLVLGLVHESSAFSECPNSALADPNISGVTNCLSWLAYLQSQGTNLLQWCSVSANYQKCCLTCQNYQSVLNCTDIAYEPDCREKAAAGLCSTNLADSNTIRIYCRKSCGLCSASSTLTCTNLIRNCNAGTCVSSIYFQQQSIQCQCPSGASGSYCETTTNTNACLSNPCLNNGICNLNAQGSYSCICLPGFIGANCGITNNANPCSSDPCLNFGICNLSGSSYSCVCLPGYSGPNCGIVNNNPCAVNPCLNNGVCTANGNSYSCVCKNGFSGTNCEFSSPCFNYQCLNQGTCLINLLNQPYCVCQNGFTGSRCESSLNACSSAPCLNGGFCQSTANLGFFCTCPNSFTGTRCETQTNVCAPNPCQNNAICTPSGSSYTCICLPGFSGPTCAASSPCSSNPCQNGGFCQSLFTGSYTCTCSSPFTGPNCQFANNACFSNNPCQNGGICSINSLGQATCQCINGFTGPTCAQFPSSSTCNNLVCQNGGRCEQNGGVFRCVCPPNVYGNSCEFVVTLALCSRGDSDSRFCPKWSQTGFCNFVYTYNSIPVPIYCPISCNMCGNVRLACQDSQRNCAFWAQMNMCAVVNNRDPNLCKRSCGLCGDLTKKKKKK